MDEEELRTTGVAKGGAAIAREASGRVVFVAGALPDELVRVVITDRRRDFAHAELSAVIEPSLWRVEPPCPFVRAGCGGCDLQHASIDGQRALKELVIADALRRIGRLPTVPPVDWTPLSPVGYRTTVRGVAHDGRFGFRRRSSHEPIAVGPCLIAHPLIDELICEGRFGDADAVTLRASAATGERLVVTSGARRDVHVPAGVTVVTETELRRGREATITEAIAGVPLRISARSFFQARPDGAVALVDVVRSLIADIPDDATAIDLYAGVGLFAATAFARFARVITVEQSGSSVDDCRVNVPRARVYHGTVESWKPVDAGVVIADPSRRGLGREAVGRIGATGTPRLILVSCDAAAFGRDVALLQSDGYALRDVVAVDLFPQTSHIEIVSRFDRVR